MNDIYSNLCQITIDNLQKHSPKETIHFEDKQGLCYSIFSYPRNTLLEINGIDDFINFVVGHHESREIAKLVCHLLRIKHMTKGL